MDDLKRFLKFKALLRMRPFAWLLSVLGVGLSLLAAAAQYCDWLWVAVLLSCLAGASFSALMSLIVARMILVHDLVAESLVEAKATNPLTETMGKNLQIRLEVLTDLGFKESSVFVEALKTGVAACDSRASHTGAANPLYRALQHSAFPEAAQSLFFPKYPHGTEETGT